MSYLLRNRDFRPSASLLTGCAPQKAIFRMIVSQE